MDSKLLHGTPLSATMAAAKFPVASFTGIRAPLTLDDSDLEYSVSATGKKDGTFSSSSSDSEFQSGGFDSGEDEFETGSNRALVSGLGSASLEDSRSGKSYVVTRPFVKNPNEKFIQESSSVRAFDDSRPLLFDENQEGVEDSDNFEEDIDRGTSAADVGEGKNASVIESPVVRTGNVSQPNQGMPIAKLSWDSDDDFVGSETSEDGSSLGIVRVPDSGFQEKLGNAPKVRVLDVGEVEDSASQTENLSQAKIVEESVVEGGDNDVKNSDTEGNHLVLQAIVPDSISAEVNEDKNSVVTEEEEIVGKSIVEGVDNEVINSNSEGNHLIQEQIVPESISAEVNEDKDPVFTKQAEILKESTFEGDDNEVMKSSNEGNNLILEEIVPYSMSTEVNRDKDPTVTEQMEAELFNQGIEEPNPRNLIVEETNDQNMVGFGGVTEVEATEVEAVDNFGPESTDINSHRNGTLEASITAVLSQNNDNEKVVNEIEQHEVESHDCNAPKNSESADSALVLDIAESMKDAELSETRVAQKSECFEIVGFPDTTESLDGESNVSQDLHQCSDVETEACAEINNDLIPSEQEEKLLQFDATQNLNAGGSERGNAKDELEEVMSSDSVSCGESSQGHSQVIDAMTSIDSKDEPKISGDLQEGGISDSSGLAAPQSTSTGSGLDGGKVLFISADGTRLISLEELARSGSAVHSLEPINQPNSATLFGPSKLMATGISNKVLSEEKKNLEKLQQIRVKFLRLLRRLKQSPEDSEAAKVLYQLLLASGRPFSEEFSFDFAKQAAMELEAEGDNKLDFSLNILVIGKSGVGKSATINSIFGEDKAVTNAFEPATTGLRQIKGTLDGIPIQVLDTPGLRSSVMEQSTNRKILMSIKKIMRKLSPDVVLYVDRLDLETGDLSDLPLLKSITSYLGSSVWLRTILTLTHAASTPPEGPSGNTLSYELFVAQRSHTVRQLISHSVGDLHILQPSLIPVSLVENRSKWGMNGSDHVLTPYKETWRSKLLLLCYSMKILSEIDSIVREKDVLHPSKFHGLKIRSLRLPHFLSSLLQSSAHPKISATQGGEDVDSDIELARLSDYDEGSEDEYDQLPAFRPLRKSQIAELDKEQRKAYFEEYDYRVKLLQKKQLKEEVRRARDIKQKLEEGTEAFADMEGDLDQKMESQEAPAVPLQDMVLPPSFDGDNPTYRYRFLEPSFRIVTRPVLDAHGWDHDFGYDGINIEDNLAIAGQFPAVITVQLTKDKRKFNIHLNSSVSAKHGEEGSSMAGLDIGSIGNQLAYTLKTETKLKSFKVNKSAAGISLTFLGGNVITGIKFEDQIAAGKNVILVGTTGLCRCQKDAAYGANLAIRLKDKDYPLEQDQHLIGLSVMRWRGDNVLGLNLQSQFSLGRNSKLGVTAGVNSKKSGQVSLRISSSDDLHIAILGLLPVAKTIIRNLFAAGQ